MKEQEYVSIEGNVENIVYSNEQTGFAVLDVNVGEEPVCVIGELFSVEVGEELKVTGYYQTHPTFGSQFKAEYYERRLPATENAICKYLSSGVVKGIGPVTARRIVERFGKDTLKIIEETPERLMEISGITRQKTEKLAEDFKQVFGVRTLMLFLQQHGLNAMQSVLIFKRWGSAAMDFIRENPYILSIGDLGIPFDVADNIARSYSLPLNCPERIFAGIHYVLSHNLSNGHTCLPRRMLLPAAARLLSLDEGTISDELDKELEQGNLSRRRESDEFIYLPELFEAQLYIANRLDRMLQTGPDKPAPVEDTILLIEQERGIQYEKLQKKAIVQAVQNNAFILTGGPGTGKTTTLNGILSVLEQQGLEVALAAPTGRAAKRMSEVTGREAKTIHRLLEVSVGYQKTGRVEFVHNEEYPLDADAVIVDEMSMVDSLLFCSLLQGMRPEAKLIMVGDFHQLPSVGAGNILRDLIESDVVPMVELTRIFRQAAKSLIVTNAHAIVSGEMPNLEKKDNDFFFLPQNNPERAVATILGLCAERLPKTYGFSPFDDIQVLCPSRRGELGVTILNNHLQEKLNPRADGKIEFKAGQVVYRTGDKVMQIRNNYDIAWTRGEEKSAGIFNGDIGIIKMIDRGSRTMAIDFDGRLAYYTFDMTSELELAYAVTVHKSQGSEFEAIILPVMDGYDKLFFRNLLYTAVTRAKRILILIGQKSRIEFMVKNNRKMLRYTGLKGMLQERVYNNG